MIARWPKRMRYFRERLVVRDRLGMRTSPERELMADFFLAGRFINLDCDCQIPRGNSIRFKESRFGVAGAAGDLSGDDVGEALHPGPAGFVTVKREDEIAGFLT